MANATAWRYASLWAETLEPRFAPVTVDHAVDVVVIGAGITGLLTATLLARSGADVMVVDRYEIGGIATRNTTAKISALQGTVYRDIAASRGAATAGAYAAAQLDAVEGMRNLIEALDIDCALTEAPAFTYGTELHAGEETHAEYEAASEAGIPARWATDTELPFDISGAVRLDGQLHFNPAAFCTALANELPSGRVAELTAVRGVEEHSDGCTVILENGTKIASEHVVIATQGPMVDPALLVNRCTPMQSYAIAARLPGPVPVGMYLSCDTSVRSLRPATADDGSTMVIVGGEGHHMGDRAADPARWEALETWTRQHFGGADVTHRWATHDLVPTDHVPFIGRLVAGATRRWVATGFAKWGMTNGYVAARLISTSIGGGTVPWAEAFDSTRIMSTLNRELASIGATAGRHLVIDRITRRAEPRCTHQGCVLRRDSALGTWDCPCHGSRFTEDGTVIQGPASSPLRGG